MSKADTATSDKAVILAVIDRAANVIKEDGPDAPERATVLLDAAIDLVEGLSSPK